VVGLTPGALSFAAHAGASAVLRSQDIAAAGVGVAPVQVSVQVSDQRWVVRWSDPAMTKVYSGPNWASIGKSKRLSSG
jgi:hypothetical protein